VQCLCSSANNCNVSQVLGHLHPIDLYHLSHTTHFLRNMVMKRSATSLWKTVFSRHPDIPECPPDLSEPRWAAMLFGPDTCDVSEFSRVVLRRLTMRTQYCGRHGALVDFAFRSHFCDECMEKQYDLMIISHASHFNSTQLPIRG
jgi:hypothetical protein